MHFPPSTYNFCQIIAVCTLIKLIVESSGEQPYLKLELKYVFTCLDIGFQELEMQQRKGTALLTRQGQKKSRILLFIPYLANLEVSYCLLIAWFDS